MVTHDCDTCSGEGEVLTMVPGSTGEPVEGTVDCPDCGGDGYFETPARFERLVGVERAERLRRPFHRARRRAEWAKARWAERNAATVAAMVTVHGGALADEPRLRSIVDNDLRRQLEDVTPLRWRRDDVRWCWENAKRAARGQPMLPLPYEDSVDVHMNREHADFFQRDTVAIVAERHRKPREQSSTVEPAAVVRDPCGCPRNEVGDIRCHLCGEYVNVRCWQCKTPRGHGPCPNAA